MCFDAAGERFGPRMKLRHFQRELAPLLPILTSAGIAKTSLTSLSTPLLSTRCTQQPLLEVRKEVVRQLRPGAPRLLRVEALFPPLLYL